MSTIKKRHDPATLAEWQSAVDAAGFYLALDSAKQYRLIETDIQVDTDRCIDLLTRAKRFGVEPAPLDQLIPRFLPLRSANAASPKTESAKRRADINASEGSHR